MGVAEGVWREGCVRVNVRCVWVAFVCCCFACDCVLELVVCRVRFARVSCPWLRFESGKEPEPFEEIPKLTRGLIDFRATARWSAT